MLDIGWSELVIIGIVALVVVGPKELPTLLRTVGQWVGKARRMASEFQGQINDAIREAELDDVKKSVDDLRSLSPSRLVADQFASITDEVKSIGASTQSELAKIEAGAAEPWSASETPEYDAFTETSVPPAISASEAEGLIDAAAGPVADLPAPVFDVTPAPGPSDVPAAPPAEHPVVAEAPVETADKKATGA